MRSMLDGVLRRRTVLSGVGVNTLLIERLSVTLIVFRCSALCNRSREVWPIPSLTCRATFELMLSVAPFRMLADVLANDVVRDNDD
jgi:hypothetical protein